MDTTEVLIESVLIAILAGQGSLPAAVHYERNTDPVAEATRVTVQCMPKATFAHARKTTLLAPVWQAVATIQVQVPLTATPAELSTLCAAVDTAMEGTPPAGAITLAQASFSRGFEIQATEGGDRSAAGESVRTTTRIYTVIFRL